MVGQLRVVVPAVFVCLLAVVFLGPVAAVVVIAAIVLLLVVATAADWL